MFRYKTTIAQAIKENIERAQQAAAMNIQVETAQTGMPFAQELDNYID